MTPRVGWGGRRQEQALGRMLFDSVGYVVWGVADFVGSGWGRDPGGGGGRERRGMPDSVMVGRMCFLTRWVMRCGVGRMVFDLVGTCAGGERVRLTWWVLVGAMVFGMVGA